MTVYPRTTPQKSRGWGGHGRIPVPLRWAQRICEAIRREDDSGLACVLDKPLGESCLHAPSKPQAPYGVRSRRESTCRAACCAAPGALALRIASEVTRTQLRVRPEPMPFEACERPVQFQLLQPRPICSAWSFA